MTGSKYDSLSVFQHNNITELICPCKTSFPNQPPYSIGASLEPASSLDGLWMRTSLRK